MKRPHLLRAGFATLTIFPTLILTIIWLSGAVAPAGEVAARAMVATWSQWRGPSRDGQVAGTPWPSKLSDGSVTPAWRVPLAPGYGGPIVSEQAVFVTETRDKTTEVVRALDRQSGRELWNVSWPGAISVPFYAKSRGDWIRSTPAYDGKTLFVAGMRDVLVALDARTGRERWRVDFVRQFNSSLPDFGLICSPLVDGDFVFIQAANSLVKLRKATGEIVWRAFEGRPGVMSEGSFSSPIMATIAGQRQLVVQSRENLAGVDPVSGRVLWQQPVPSFRGMNILTPVVFGDSVFTSSYQNKSWTWRIGRIGTEFKATESWSSNASGYMSTPVIVGDYAYLHLGNQRFTCIDLRTGERTWTSMPFGKYVSLVAQGDRILGLDERGVLLLIKANPQEFQLIDQFQVSEDEAWAHLAVAGDELFVRELRAIASHRWRAPRGR